MTVSITPTKDHPVPYDLSAETVDTLLDEMTLAANTAELQNALGAPLTLDPDDTAREQTLLKEVVEKGKTKNLTQPNTAFAAGAFLRTYGAQLALDVAAARAAVTNKLMEIANCGDPRYELKALELLGKHKDISLFTDRSEVTINYKDPAHLENEIKERVKRLMNASVVETVPQGAALDDELGVFEHPNKALYQAKDELDLPVVSEDSVDDE
jgi:hypothetical protein